MPNVYDPIADGTPCKPTFWQPFVSSGGAVQNVGFRPVSSMRYYIFYENGCYYRRNGLTGEIDDDNANGMTLLQDTVYDMPSSGDARGGHILIKSLGYRVIANQQVTVDRPLTILGEGSPVSSGGTTPFFQRTQNLNNAIFKITGDAKYGVKLANLRFVGLGKATDNNTGVEIDLASGRVALDNVAFVSLSTGLKVNYTEYSNYEKLIFCANDTGAYFTGSAIKMNNNNVFDHCMFGNANNVGLKFEMGGNNTFNTCNFMGNDIGLQMRYHVNGNEFWNPWFEACTTYDIDLNETTSTNCRWTRFIGGHQNFMKVIIGSKAYYTRFEHPSLTYSDMFTSLTDNGLQTQIITRDQQTAYQTIEHHTAADTLTNYESGSVHTNLGAGANVKLTLPQNAYAGISFKFVVMTAGQQLQVDPGAAGAIYINGAKQTDDLYIWADDEAESVELVADGNGDWIAVGTVGTWTVET